jgi:hypothetical protein
MPIKKGKGKKKQIKQKQKQRQTQVQKVVVNIHKSASKRSAVPKSSVASKSLPSSMPIYQAEPIAYPSYRRQAQAVPVEVELPSAIQNTGRRIGEIPNPRYYENRTDTTLKLPLTRLKYTPEQLLANNKELLRKISSPSITFETLHNKPSDYFVQENPLIKKTNPAAAAATRRQYDDKPAFQPVNEEIKPKRQYTRKPPDIPRRNSNEDLLNRYEAATGGSYEGPTLKVGAFKAIVEELEQQ